MYNVHINWLKYRHSMCCTTQEHGYTIVFGVSVIFLPHVVRLFASCVYFLIALVNVCNVGVHLVREGCVIVTQGLPIK